MEAGDGLPGANIMMHEMMDNLEDFQEGLDEEQAMQALRELDLVQREPNQDGECVVPLTSLALTLGLSAPEAVTIGTEAVMKLMLEQVMTGNPFISYKCRAFCAKLREDCFQEYRDMLYACIIEIMPPGKHYVVTESTSKTAVVCLRWILESIHEVENPSPLFYEVYSLLLRRINASRFDSVVVRSSERAFITMPFSTIIQMSERFLEMEELAAASVVIRHAERTRRRIDEACVLPDSIKNNALNFYIQEFFRCKVAQPTWYIKKVSHSLLCILNKENFSSVMFPAVQLAMKRAPETYSEALVFVLNSFEFPLDSICVDVAKILAPNLLSSDDNVRKFSSEASEALCRWIEGTELKAVVSKFLDTFKDGKVAVVAHKVHLLKTIDKMFPLKMQLNDSEQDAYRFLISRTIKILESEAHEGIQLQAMEIIINKMNKLREPFQELKNYFHSHSNKLKGNLRTKFTFVLVRAVCQYEPDKGRNHLYKFYEESSKQIPQINSVVECMAIASALMEWRLCATSSIGSDYGHLFNHMEKLLTCTVPDAIAIASRFSTLFLCMVRDIQPSVWNGAVFLLATDDPNSRKAVFSNIIPCMGQPRRPLEDHLAFNNALMNLFSTCNLQSKVRKNILRKWLLGSNLLSQSDRVKLLVAVIPITHFDSTITPWADIVRELGMNAKDIICENSEELVKEYVLNFDNSPMKELALRTLALHGGETIITSVINEFMRSTEHSDMLSLSLEHYMIYQTPEGQLYDESVISSNEDVSKNIKRESRAYSHKEQLEEIQLRKEIEKNRKASGKTTYTPKQKEAINQQLAKENEIRIQVSKLYSTAMKSIGLVKSSWEGNSVMMSDFLKDLIFRIVQLTKSYLVAEVAAELYVTIGMTLLAPKIKAQAVGMTYLRWEEPYYDLPPEWLEANIEDMTESSLKFLIESCDGGELRGATVAWVFPFMKKLLTLKNKKHIVDGALNLIQKIATDEKDTLKASGKGLPRRDIIYELYNVIKSEFYDMDQKLSSQQSIWFAMDLAAVCMSESTIEPTDILTDEELKLHLNSLKTTNKCCRETAINALERISFYLPCFEEPILLEIVNNIFRVSFDNVSSIADTARYMYETCQFEITQTLLPYILSDVVNPTEDVRTAASKALAEYVRKYKLKLPEVYNSLLSEYNEYEELIPPVVDHLGRVLEESVDRWEQRCGIASALRELAPEMNNDIAKSCMNWMVQYSLKDRSAAVHNVLLEAAVEIVNQHGRDCLTEFIETIDGFLETASSSSQNDRVRQACVVLTGGVAKHMDPSDPRVRMIFDTLLDTLSTPSEKVQEAVAHCLPGLGPAVKSDAEQIFKNLMSKLMDGETYGERRGAAYGIAGMIKGIGILCLKKYDMMNSLAVAMQDKKNYKHREGALMAVELVLEFMNRLFEPYVVHVIPHLLHCFGDPNSYVREATENTSKKIMSNLSGHGVKLVLPAILTALNEDSWRTKCGSVDLLGRMAFCAPKQLSGCLPQIVPRLIEVLGDSHAKVQDSGAKALQMIGSVIQNPEIQNVVPILLQALQDPGKKSTSCLQRLLKTQFVHVVDSPSLALIMPVVQRAFQDRSTENRKMACQVIGNMYSLTQHSDLAPYMESVMPGIKNSLVDPDPEVRAVAAKALGSMAKGMGDKVYDELLPWLMKTLISEVSSVDRSGAAQGLAEILGSFGVEKLGNFMPEIIKKSDDEELEPHVRDGYLMMYIFTPPVFGSAFVPYIDQIINPILKGLADENEYVRDTAYKAGQRIVTGYAESAITLLLPQLEKGIFDDNWRIRSASIALLGDLLYKISGVSGKMSTESAGEDDNFGTEQSQQSIISRLGQERRNRVLAGLYMGRSDTALMVRQAALHVWKVVVANTPKTLREILPTLFSLLLGCLASPSHDKRTVAARTLGDLVRKLGEKILPEIIPILENGLNSERSDERQGVCIGLSEIMASTSRDMILAFVDNLVPTLRKALCDPNSQVREAAAKTFASLHSNVGNKALEEIVPHLMRKLNESNSEESEFALDGLGQILHVKSKAVLPFLIPQLIAPPVNTKALATLSSVAGDSVAKHLGKILPALLSVLEISIGYPNENNELEHCERVILNITDDQGVRMLIDDLLENVKKGHMKRSAVKLLAVYCINTKADLEPYTSQLIRGFFPLMIDTSEDILNIVADGISAVVKRLDSVEKLSYVADVRQALRFAKSDLQQNSILPGLCTSKGISPVLPIFREALLNGSADTKEQAAIGMGELILLSNEKALKPSVIHITGPLIRILGDRYGPTVKMAVLDTLSFLLMKVGIHLKAFLPQLQTTFLKSCFDSGRSVRLKAASALAQLMPIHSKPDTMVQDLINGIKQCEEVATRDTMIFTIRCVLSSGGDKLSDAAKKNILSLLAQQISSSDESTSLVSGGAIGVMLATLSSTDVDSVINLLLQDEDVTSVRYAKTTGVFVALNHAPSHMLSDKYRDKVQRQILSLLASDKAFLVMNGIRCICYILIHYIKNNESIPTPLIQPFVKTLNHASNDVKLLTGQAAEVVGKQIFPLKIPVELYKTFIPALVMGTKEKNSMVRSSCESALIRLLQLRTNDSVLNECLENLETGAAESLSDVVSKVLRKSSTQVEGKEPDIDISYLYN